MQLNLNHAQKSEVRLQNVVVICASAVCGHGQLPAVQLSAILLVTQVTQKYSKHLG